MSDLAEPLPGVQPAAHRNRALGYSLYLIGATLFALNGTVSKTILLTDIPAARLSQLRITGAFVVLLVFVAITRPASLRIHRGEWLKLCVYGVLGVAMTQFLYFFALQSLNVGVTLVIEFTAPIMVALWFRFGRHQPMKRTVWLALVIAILGMTMVVQIWQGFTLDALGVTAAFGAAVALAVYYVMGEGLVSGPGARDAVSLTMWGFGFGALFWAITQPWWTFPWDQFVGVSQPLAGSGPHLPLWVLVVWMILLGTVVPFWLVVSAMRHITASQASTIGMAEPLIAILIAWVLLGEVLTVAQWIGALVVLTGVYLAERSR